MEQPKCRFTRVYLEERYEPSAKDVACGRGADYYFHSGNIAFRHLLYRNLDRYCAASTKLEKSQIVAEVFHVLSTTDDEPVKFIRYDNHKQRWYVLDIEAAKQKIGQSIREFIHRHYPNPRVFKAKALDEKYVAKKMVERFQGDANDNFDVKEISLISLHNQTAPAKISGHQDGLVVPHGNSSEGARSNLVSQEDILARYESNTPESSQEWFTIGGLSKEDSDVVDIIDNVF